MFTDFLFPAVAGGGGYTVDNSLRLNASASAYLSKTPSTGDSRKKHTISVWVKRGVLSGTNITIFNARVASGGTAYAAAYFDSNDKLNIQYYDGSSNQFLLTTTQVFRDTTAWYHLVFICDTTQTSGSGQYKIYVNGTQITAFDSATYATQNYDTQWGLNIAHRLGAGYWNPLGGYLDGYFAEINVLDGIIGNVSDFGESDSNGIWIPKAYSGSYGTNGFYLDFSNSVALGEDAAGSNDWAVNNITSADQCDDTSTNNYSVLNNIDKSSNAITTIANLKMGITSDSTNTNMRGTIGISSGKYYWEVTTFNTAGVSAYVGVGTNAAPLISDPSVSALVWLYYANDGNKYNGSGSSYGDTWTTSGDKIMVALDMDNGKVWFGKNGVWQASGDPAVGTNAAFTGLSGTLFPFFGLYRNNWTFTLNFGQFAFTYTPPTGFNSINTLNLESTAVSTSGSFTGNASNDGPFIWLEGDPTILTINGNSVTFGSHADKTAGGFKLRTSSSSYNTSGTNTWTATAGDRFVGTDTTPNTAKTNP